MATRYAAAGLSRLGQEFNRWTTRINSNVVGIRKHNVGFLKRGNRAGVRLQRAIVPRITVRATRPHSTGSVNVNNLVTVPIDRNACLTAAGDLRNNKLKLAVLNSQSVRNKATEVVDFI